MLPNWQRCAPNVLKRSDRRPSCDRSWQSYTVDALNEASGVVQNKNHPSYQVTG
jgi:hypothetical protein